MAERKRAVKQRRREKKNVPQGHVHIQATFNNTIITITDLNGAVISWGSAGVAGIKGSRKSTPYAAALSAAGAAKRAMDHGMRQVEVYVRGPGAGREQAIRSLQAAGLEVSAITDVTPILHSGCRPPERRRVESLRSHGPLHRIRLPPLPPGRRKALPEGKPLLFQEVLVRAAPDASRPARRPPPQGRRVRPPASREAEGPTDLRGPRAPVPQLLRRRGEPTRCDVRAPPALARVAARQRGLPDGHRRLARAGPPLRGPRSLRRQRPADQHLVVSAQAGRQGRGPRDASRS